MPLSDGPSVADQQLIDHAARRGLTVTGKQLADWRRAGLLPGNIPGGGLGRGRGSTSTPSPESFDLVLALAHRAGRGKRPTDLALLLFTDGHPVPEATVRAAFRSAVESVALPGEDGSLGDDLELEEHVDHVMERLTETGQAFILVPARARRIDERIARIVGEPPAELAELDKNIEPTPMTPQDASLAAVTAVLGGTMSVQEIGDLLRGMNPSMAAHPFASLVETTQQDSPDAANQVMADDGSLTFLPQGDVRDELRDLADTASLEDLAVGWRTAQQVREWALGLCGRVEAELDAGQPGEAVSEWLNGRGLPSGLSVLETLRERRSSPSSSALSALLLLFQRQMYAVFDGLVPGCQGPVLEMPGVLAPPVRDLSPGRASACRRRRWTSTSVAATTGRPRPTSPRQSVSRSGRSSVTSPTSVRCFSAARICWSRCSWTAWLRLRRTRHRSRWSSPPCQLRRRSSRPNAATTPGGDRGSSPRIPRCRNGSC
jgi:hypothetical protein